MPKALIFYHYFSPDDVVSATHISELAKGLIERGWQVTAMPCNRGCREEAVEYPAIDWWNGVEVRRVWRPAIKQSTSFGRIFNAIWMVVRWSLAALNPKPPDVVIIGTDPVLSVLAARFWKLIRPRTRIVHWCFDLYPEAAIADAVIKEHGLVHRILRWLLRPAYCSCDLIVDIGSCMRTRIAQYAPGARFCTLTPWALVEPSAPLEPNPSERRALFGDASISLLYSGNFGRAHSYQEILQLMRSLRNSNATLAFSVRGNRVEALRSAVDKADSNIVFRGFAPPEGLEHRLGAPDIHVVSLHPEWAGMVVPSKFFGAIAAGRPVLFAGSRESSVAKWIEEFQLGWVVSQDNVEQVAQHIAAHVTDNEQRSAMRLHCHRIHQEHFSRQKIIDRFDHELRRLMEQSSGQAEATRHSSRSQPRTQH